MKKKLLKHFFFSFIKVSLFLLLFISCEQPPAPDDNSNNNSKPKTKVKTPSFNPVPGTYKTEQTIAITTATKGATIRYTINGSTPTSDHGAIYTNPILISCTTTLKAIAYKDDFTASSVESDEYIITGTVAAPNFSPSGGFYTTAQDVEISTTTEGATIIYTTDGSTPTSGYGLIYSAPINVSSSMTLKAIAYKSGWTDSSVSTAIYTGLTKVPYSTPMMSSAAQDGYRVSGNWQLFNPFATYNFGDIPWINGVLYLPEKVYINRIKIGAYWVNPYYFARGATLTFYLKGVKVYSMNIDPLSHAGTDIIIPDVECDQITNSTGWGSAWGGDGGGQSQTGKQFIGYKLE